MKKLSTIQKMENLNDIFAVDEQGPGGAHHLYQVCKHSTARICEEDNTFRTRPENMILTVQMQCRPRNDPKSIPGALDTDLLEIVRDRMKDFQAGPYASEYNAQALLHVELALMYLNRRVEDRIERGVLGTNEK